MYDYIKGIYMGMHKEYVVVENNGIGYKISVSGSTISELPKKEEEVLLYIEQMVREDFIGLYGFFSKEEREMFNLLLTINGVGAKAALSLLSISSVHNLKYAILIGDEKTLTRAPGVGKKIAQRIILELKDKLKGQEVAGIIANNAEDISKDNNISEALQALLALGYTEREANKALEKVNKAETIENIIKEALKYLMG
ncbi:Holliday junction DNA helicase subunit RuvA [Clostridium amylolyticum]|uniref:Holliday junction branch migration complex subunit RuvA n=1 Tax=Clostridium amylolyticum TaxID=1121298 RepID=A0A1M6CVH1_9CLOT|nr:Holliday junction branch migration protein RuvA [Clostridium amylolyticum]SHI64804.1 Holliday junction DNA helicase subunit RuvA [Clostridium amylolyticum]